MILRYLFPIIFIYFYIFYGCTANLVQVVQNGDLESVKSIINKDKSTMNVKDEFGNLVIHKAAAGGHLNIVRFLIESGSDINARNNFGETPLHVASLSGHLEVVKYLVSQTANFKTVDNRKTSPMHDAVKAGKPDVASYLLTMGADPNAIDQLNDSPLYYAVKINQSGIIKALILNGANINYRNTNDETALHIAAYNGNIDIVKYLLSHGADVNAKDKANITPLHLAAYKGNFDIVMYLVDQWQADVNVRGNISYGSFFSIKRIGTTPLHLSAFYGSSGIVKYLLSHGADVNAKDKANITPLHLAAYKGHLDIVMYLVDRWQADLNVRGNLLDSYSSINKNGTTPLHLSAANGHFGVVKYLISKRADINSKDDEGNTPIHESLSSTSIMFYEKYFEIVKYLISSAALVNVQNIYGRSPLHIAATKDVYETVKYLVEKGAEVNIKDKKGDTPINLATRSGNLEIIKYLAAVNIRNEKNGIEDKNTLNIASHIAFKEIEATEKKIKRLEEGKISETYQSMKNKKLNSTSKKSAEDDKKISETQIKVISNVLSKADKKAQLETKLTKLKDTLYELDKMKRRLEKEQKKSEMLTAKLEETIKEKKALEVRLESEADVKKQLEITIMGQETALKRQIEVVEKLYEKERMIKSKNFQLVSAKKEADEYRKKLEEIKIKAVEMKRIIHKAKSDQDTEAAKEELNKILHEKTKIQKEADNLKEKESKLIYEVAGLSEVVDKTRLEAETVKKELVSMRAREAQLVDQVNELKNRLNRGMKPVLVVTKPKNNSIMQSPTTMLHLTAIDDKGINNIRVFLNGKPLKLNVVRGMELVAADKVNHGKRIDVNKRLHLQFGQNIVKVVVTDVEEMSKKEVIKIIREKEHGDIWAVVIGINKYKNNRDLKYAVNDAKAFKNYLTEYIGILKENMFFLTDQNATKDNIQSLLGTQLRRKASKDDTVIIFYAGHGAAEIDPSNPDGDGFEKYLLPYDAKLNDLYTTAISMDEIHKIFQRIQAERLIFIADTCYSGASGGRTMLASATRASLSEKFFERISKSKGRVIISSSSANEVSKEDDNLKHGIFSFYLLEGLKGKADNDGDGIITVSELFSYLSRKVPEASGQDQHPVRKGEVEGELVIGRIK